MVKLPISAVSLDRKKQAPAKPEKVSHRGTGGEFRLKDNDLRNVTRGLAVARYAVRLVV